MDLQQLANIIEAALLAAGKPLSVDKLLALFPDDARPERQEIREALERIRESCAGRSFELKEVASGFRLQIRQDYSEWISRLWEERPPRYSRALLETLALIAYKQPITRAEIEEVRGVSVSSHIIKTLQDRGWVRVVGHRDVPGRPALYATTREFLDYFNLKGLDELPSLAEIRDIETINAELDLEPAGPAEEGAAADAAENSEGGEGDSQREAAGGEAGSETARAEVVAASAGDETVPVAEPDRTA